MFDEPSFPRADRSFIVLVIAGGVALRLIWLLLVQGELAAFPSAGEAQRVALALARTGSFADAYFDGQGPTAHILPVSAAIAGGILWLFGPFSDAASLVLLLWALVQTFGGYLLLVLFFRQCGMRPIACRWALALLCLVPPFVVQEVVDFRYWESGLAAMLATTALLLVAKMDGDLEPTPSYLAGTGALIAMLFFVAPFAGLAAGSCAGLMVLLRWRSLHTAVPLAGAFALCLALMIVPWAARNAHMLGAAIPLRSNAGLELAIADHPAALSDRAPEYVFAERIAAIHPAANPALRAMIRQRGGEVRYSRQLGRETSRWIAAHPVDFARLLLRHLRQYFFPEPWQFYFSGWEGARAARSITIMIVSALGLAGLAVRLVRQPRQYLIVAAYVCTIAACYAPFQPMARYIYLSYGLLAFLAVDLIGSAVGGVIRKR